MVKFKSGILIVVSFALFSLSAYAQQVKLMSYNIGSANWATTKDSVIARITSNDPDIFCAVEARPYNNA